MSEELKKFIEENGFIKLEMVFDLWVSDNGDLWHLDEIEDALWAEQNDKARDSVDWLT